MFMDWHYPYRVTMTGNISLPTYPGTNSIYQLIDQLCDQLNNLPSDQLRNQVINQLLDQLDNQLGDQHAS
jgi:hypothetical protein